MHETIQEGKTKAIQVKKPERGKARKCRREDEGYTIQEARAGEGSATTQSGKVKVMRIKRPQRRRIGDDTERKGSDYTDQEATEGGVSVRIQKGQGYIDRESTKGEDRRRHRNEMQRL